jgi:type I restriction enzyme M protein
MSEQKLTQAKFESLLFKVWDLLRGKTDAAEYKEHIRGMLFLKRMSGQFEADRESLRKKRTDKNHNADAIQLLLDDKTQYNY